MDKRTFQAAVFDLSIFFERKPPSDATVSQWYEEVRHLPNTHITELSQEVKRLESWPRNLPAFLVRKSSGISETRGENNQYAIHPRRIYPHKFANKSCTVCVGTGLTKWITDEWPSRKDEDGNTVLRHREEICLCPCTDYAEYGF